MLHCSVDLRLYSPSLHPSTQNFPRAPSKSEAKLDWLHSVRASCDGIADNYSCLRGGSNDKSSPHWSYVAHPISHSLFLVNLHPLAVHRFVSSDRIFATNHCEFPKWWRLHVSKEEKAGPVDIWKHRLWLYKRCLYLPCDHGLLSRQLVVLVWDLLFHNRLWHGPYNAFICLSYPRGFEVDRADRYQDKLYHYATLCDILAMSRAMHRLYRYLPVLIELS